MAHPRELSAATTAMDTLQYIQAPAVGLTFFGAAAFGAIYLQKPRQLPKIPRRIASTLMFAILATFLAEVLLYFSRSLADSDYQPPHSAAIKCLGSILLWGPLSILLSKAEKARWNSYIGAFVLEFCFDMTLCLLGEFAVEPQLRSHDAPLLFNILRTILSLFLVVDWFLIHFGRQSEKATDEEGQALLGNQPNGASGIKANGGYGSVDPDASDSVDDSADEGREVVEDRDKVIKEKQAKRLEEEGGWVGYLKSFAIFLPELFPSKDRLVMLCLFIRGVSMLQARVFNVLVPRQLGIITDKLASGTTVMPWADIGLWALYKWIKSYAGFGLVDNFAEVVIENKSSVRLQQKAYRHVLDLSMDFHADKSTGEVIKAVEQASSLNRLVSLVLFDVFPIIMDVVISVWYVTHLFDSYMAFMILFLGVIYVYSNIYVTVWSRERRRVMFERKRSESRIINETLHNWTTVFYFNRAPYEYTRYSNALWSTINAYYSYYYAMAISSAVQDIVMSMGFIGCCTFAISQIISGAKPVGNLITFIMYWQTMISPLYMMAHNWRTVSNTLIDAERMLQLLNTKPSVDDMEGAEPIVVAAGKVEFKDVEFAYDPRKQIIKKANLTAEGGQTIAFVGETGGGKSTMLKLLSRGYDVTGGSISIDGQDVRSITRASLREIMGHVPQDPELFNTSIRENLRYGRLDATNAEIEDACRAAAIHDTIVGFPDGYKSKVGERGVKLSGGQLQRVAIARVLLRNPKIVLLDEATSAVDSTIEALIQEAFKKLKAGRTTFVVAHRLSTIVEADQILVVEKGEITERGTHSELVEIVGGKYLELWTKQTAGHISKASSMTENGGEQPNELLVDLTPLDATTTGSGNEGGGEMETEVRKR